MDETNHETTDAKEGAGDVGAGTSRSLTGRPGLSPTPSSTVLPHRQRNDADRTALRPNAAAASSAGAVAGVKKSQPAVFWSDKKSMEQQRTFYNDNTPPPSPSYVADSNNSVSIGYPSAKIAGAKNEDYDYKYDHVAPPAPIPSKGKFALTRRTLWIIVGVAITAIIALAIGLGVGLGLKNGSSGGGSDDQDGAIASETSSSVPTATSSSPEETTTNADRRSGVCPAANNTLYDVPGSEKTFLRLCGVDYSGDKGSRDLATVWTASVQDCIINCAGFDGCTACSWGVLPGDNYKDNHRCFLKTDLGVSKQARAGWDFAILQ